MSGLQPTFSFSPPAPVQAETSLPSHSGQVGSAIVPRAVSGDASSVPVNSRKYMIAIWVLVALLVLIFAWSYYKSKQTDNQIKSLGESLAGRMMELVPSQSEMTQRLDQISKLESQVEKLRSQLLSASPRNETTRAGKTSSSPPPPLSTSKKSKRSPVHFVDSAGDLGQEDEGNEIERPIQTQSRQKRKKPMQRTPSLSTTKQAGACPLPQGVSDPSSQSEPLPERPMTMSRLSAIPEEGNGDDDDGSFGVDCDAIQEL